VNEKPVKPGIGLQTRLALTSALFTAFALGLLALGINWFTGAVFTELVKENIARRSVEIVRAVGEQYRPLSRSFNAAAVEAVGMSFVHDGYLVTVEDGEGNLVWNARSCDMGQCMQVVSAIAARMEGRFRVKGSLRTEVFPVMYGNAPVGKVTVETYGPFFYSETETRFLTSVNRFFLAAALFLTLVSAALSLPLARAIARPVLKAGEAARRIAEARRSGDGGGKGVRVEEGYRTRELAGLSRSINALASELEEADARQKRLTADIAHELRTPLTCLQGTIEAMLDGAFPADREHLASCHEEVLRLAGLVRDLGALTSIEWEEIPLETSVFDLSRLIELSAGPFLPAAREKGLALRLELRESPVRGDYGRLKQVFINLLSNALNYTDRGEIRVSIREGEVSPALQTCGFPLPPLREAPPPATPPAGGGVPPRTPRLWGALGFPTGLPLRAPVAPPRTPHLGAPYWEVDVADTGIGIEAEDLSRVFERFYRSDKSRGRCSGGAGIGLTIAAAIVRAHGGTLSAESVPGAGSVFRVRLPAQ
jgi:signal transduction histidine kinase